MSPGAVLVAVGWVAAQVAMVVALSPLVLGGMARIKAMSQHRVGPPLLQGYRDLAKLFRKEPIRADSSSWVSRLAPPLAWAATVAAIPFIPWILIPTPLDYAGDLLVVVGLFALGRFLGAIAALDAGTAFGGMGSSRDMWIGALVEPAFLVVILAFGAPAGATQADAIVAYALRTGVAYLTPALLLAGAALVLVLLAEGGRIPVDNPSTHLELTMVHEAMVLEYSGPELALLEWTRALRFTELAALLAALVVPWGIATNWGALALTVGLALYVAKLLGVAGGVAFMETRIAKWRLFRVADLAVFAVVLALGSVALTYLIGGAA